MPLRRVYVLLPVLAILSTPLTQAKEARLTDSQVKQQMIAESVAAWPGRCACPWQSAKNGSRCGKRSAWSRPGGATPLCYQQDISADSVAAWRQHR